MKKTILSIIAMAFFGFAVVSCASHTSYRSYTETQTVNGSSPEGQWQKCAVCKGKGSCTTCKGTGKISGDKCSSCNGTGRCRTCDGNGGYMIN